MAEKFWGKVLGGVAKAGVLPFAAINGLYKAANGDSFDEGFDKVYENCKDDIESFEEFGDKNNDDIKDGLTGAASIVGIIVGAKAIGKK